ncbi:MAG: hypothetical protein QOF51_176 [Chloroflexota bacterium]|jgi:nucleotide-binding universal stress UspA family protein|nr:hypothetical protein [Chloroflexota bacterium]
MYGRILVAIDGSGNAERALGEALRLTKDGSAQLRLVHVVGVAPFSTDEPNLEFEGTRDLLLKAGREVLDSAARLAQQHGVKAETQLIEILTSQYGGAILDEAKSWRADLIVVGTHGRGGLKHLLLGSVAEEVIRHASAPVLLVRHNESPA